MITKPTNEEFEMLSPLFQEILERPELNYQLFELHPLPIAVYAPDGTCIYANRAMLELNNVPDASLFVGNYNGQTDPLMIEILGQETLDRIRRGETVSFRDFPAPIEDVVNRGITEGKPWEAATMDLFFLPLWDGDVFKCSVCFFTVKNKYQGRSDIAKAREYIEIHWRDEFDLDKVAQAANLSSRHFRRLFTEIVGETPQEFYQKIKIEKIKEKLLDGNLSIEQAFKACGVDSRGRYLKHFKEETGCNPSEYRKAIKTK